MIFNLINANDYIIYNEMKMKMKISRVTLLIGILSFAIILSTPYFQSALAFLNNDIGEDPSISTYENCKNGIDDDGDGLIDYDDTSDCF